MKDLIKIPKSEIDKMDFETVRIKMQNKIGFTAETWGYLNSRFTELQPIKTVWDFVEEYYPNYCRCNDIAENDDYCKIIDGEIFEGDDSHAAKMWTEKIADLKIFWGGGLSQEEIEEEAMRHFKCLKNESDAYIYKKSIEGYIDSLRPKIVDENIPKCIVTGKPLK